MSRSRTWIVAGIAVVAAAIVAGWLLTQTIPDDDLGIGSGRVVGPGRTFSFPGARLEVVPREGRLDVADIRVVDPADAESVAKFWLAGDYVLRDDVSPSLRAEIAEYGFADGVAVFAEDVLADLTERDGFEKVVSDSLAFERALVPALAAAGVDLEAPRTGVDLGDVALVRERTTEAEALAHPLRHPILFVGLDAADWHVMRPMIAAGRLPNLARLVSEGASGRLRSYDPMFSPLIWTTMATGKSPDRHGVADFVVKDAVTGEKHPITSDFRRVKALWNIFTDFKVRSAWLGWWASFPAEPIDGVVVSNLLPTVVSTQGIDAAVKTPGLISPDGYLDAHRESVVRYDQVRYEDVRRLFPLTRAEFDDAMRRLPTERRDPDSKEPEDPVISAIKLLAYTRSYQNLALDLLHDGTPVVAVYYEAIDLVGHRFQHYLPPKMEMVSEADFERFRDTVPAMYAMQDEMIGELLRAAAPDTVTMIVSDHGFRTGADRPEGFAPYTTGQPAEWHYPWGVLILHGPGIRSTDLPPTSVYDVAPTLLYLAGLPLAGDMPGRLVREAIASDELRRDAPATVASYQVVGTPLARRGPGELGSDVMGAVVAELQALGYVGGDAGGGGAAGAGTDESGKGDTALTQVYYHRNLATNLIKQGALDAAERELLAANEIEPLPKTYGLLGEIRARQGRFAEAAAAIEDGLHTVPKGMDPHAVLWLAEMWLKAGDPSKAEAALERWKDAASPAVAAAVHGRIADDAGRTAEAVAGYERALGQDPLLVHVATRLAEIYAAAGAPDRIRPFLEAGLAKEPKTDAYENLLGELDRRRRDLPGALEHFRRAVDVQPDNGLYLGNLAVTAAALGRNDEARQAVEWALRWSPSDPTAWLAIGSALDRLGDGDRAADAFRKARDLGAAGAAADVGLVMTLARHGKDAEARSALQDALRRHPDDGVLNSLRQRLGS